MTECFLDDCPIPGSARGQRSKEWCIEKARSSVSFSRRAFNYNSAKRDRMTAADIVSQSNTTE